jgi:hypothetical protein
VTGALRALPHSSNHTAWTSALKMRYGLAACALILTQVLLARPVPAWGEGPLVFVAPPALPILSNVTLTAKSQTVNTTMTALVVADTRGTKSGWNVTVAGQSGVGKSAVFAQYCPKAKCGATAEGYVSGGFKMAANSLKLSSTGASFVGGTGSAPTLKCAVACNVDSASAVKIASAATGGAGESTWATAGFSSSSLALAVPTTLRALPNEEIYRVNFLWTLSTGP